MTDIDTFLDKNDARIHNELFELLRIPSVSARSEHNADTARAAEWVATALRKAGLDTKVHATPGHPVVIGEWRKAPAGAPTILVYGHYDVQPAEPLDLWVSPP
ncbi:MAG TPA: peptidase M20, partial [Gemmatimonadaceae bacterium]|nr:peptidase M20 [Gemmatimonadaceae bacterium]